MQESFLAHKQYRYLNLGLLTIFASIVAYAWHDPVDGPNGGTWLGYTLGGYAAFLILLLMWFGIRKRQFSSSLGTLRGWLSAHVYLGLSLIIIGTLHTGFQFGWNVHTLAYALMLLVIASGIYGIVVYARNPTLLTIVRANTSPEFMCRQIAELEEQALEVAAAIDDNMRQMVSDSIKNTRIGGGFWQQLFADRQQSSHLEKSAETYLSKQEDEFSLDLSPTDSLRPGQLDLDSTAVYMAGQMSKTEPGKQVLNMRQLMDFIGQRRSLVRRLNKDVQLRARMQVWLFFHVPLSFGLLAALITHVIAVFFYW